ncbi:PiggyBac transposable element-derived protein 4, partial [Stegodyphus mimosarum]
MKRSRYPNISARQKINIKKTISKPTDPVIWSNVDQNFEPRLHVSNDRPTAILAKINRSSNELECFSCVFPRSLLIFISQCTNQRLEILRHEKKVDIPDTDPSEIMLVLGVMLVMSYNQVPNFSDYWSSNSSLGNEAIKNAISRNRCLLLFAKMYFNDPEKDANAPKTYYMDEVVACFKKTFMQAREDSPFQSIDESMAKFKGRSSLKQYLPLKPIKRGIKVWERCDAATGYTYDFNIYSGKDMDNTDHEGTILGERVVLKLSSTIRNPDVTLTFDRFFTSVNLLDNISFPSVGTCISRRKDMPKFSDEKLQKGDSEFLQNRRGTLAARWQDSKEVLILSNCHGPDVIQVKRKQKDGEKVMTNCPTTIADYNRFMGGVDLSDQKICLYDFDRRSTKWWKKVFYKLLMTAVVNAHEY